MQQKFKIQVLNVKKSCGKSVLQTFKNQFFNIFDTDLLQLTHILIF